MCSRIGLFTAHCISYGNTNNKKEKWEYKVGWCATVPVCMLKRSIDMAPVAGIIHQNHCGNCCSPEKIK